MEIVVLADNESWSELDDAVRYMEVSEDAGEQLLDGDDLSEVDAEVVRSLNVKRLVQVYDYLADLYPEILKEANEVFDDLAEDEDDFECDEDMAAE